jgi:hypothetical protein
VPLIAAALLLLVSPAAAAAEGPALAGDIPANGGRGLAVFAGGPVPALQAAASAEGCSLTAAFASVDGAFVSHVLSAPAFVNARFAAHFPYGIPPGTPLVIVCADKRTVIGTSVQGRPIEVGCLGEGTRMALLVGGMHTGANELVTSMLAVEIAHLAWNGGLAVPAGVRLCVIPTLNPDGIALETQTNANGVDLNRNWPARTGIPTPTTPSSVG